MKGQFRKLSLICFLVVAPTGLPVGGTPAQAERISPDRTDSRHMSRAPERPKWRLQRPTIVPRTIFEQAPRRGLMLERKKPLQSVTEFRKAETAACRKGNFRRFGGGYVRIGGATFRAARAPDIRRPRTVAVKAGIYVFVREGTSRCTVHLAH